LFGGERKREKEREREEERMRQEARWNRFRIGSARNIFLLILVGLLIVTVVVPYYVTFGGLEFPSSRKMEKRNTNLVEKWDLEDTKCKVSQKQDGIYNSPVKQKERKRLVVLGMHRSGTSALTGVVSQLGFYTGKLLNQGTANPKGFFERSDVVVLNDMLLHSQGCSWKLPYKFNVSNVSNEVRYKFLERAKGVIEELESNAPWILKDPRLSLTLPLWLPLFAKERDDCVIIVITRDPYEVALSMKMRRGGRKMDLRSNVALWEHYLHAIIENTRGIPLIHVMHSQLMSDPVTVITSIHKKLEKLGFSSLKPLTPSQISEFITPSLHRANAPVNANHYELLRTFQDGSAFCDKLNRYPTTTPMDDPPFSEDQEEPEEEQQNLVSLSSLPFKEKEREAFVTILTRNDQGYFLGSLVLGKSIQKTNPSKPMIALVLPDVTPIQKEQLKRIGWIVKEINPLPEYLFQSCPHLQQNEDLRQGNRFQAYSGMFSKLRIWEMEEYSKLVYLDSDTLVLKEVDLFQFPEISAHSARQTGTFNAGVLVVQPSLITFHNLLKLASQMNSTQEGKKVPRIWNALIDCTEQALLNVYFNFTFNQAVEQRIITPFQRSDTSFAQIVHFVGSRHCPKPWSYALAANENKLNGFSKRCNETIFKKWEELYHEVERDLSK
jgi:alpha-N-acetylglucosamine transferase